MSGLTIEDCAPGATVQDLGRPGYQRYGVSGSGAMDGFAHRIANALVGNPEGAATVEFVFRGGRYTVDRPALVAVTGGDFEVKLEGRPIGAWRSVALAPGEELSVGPAPDTVYGYLAVAGGIAVAPVFGSRSTQTRSHLGGLEGRALRPGDRLPLGEDPGGGVARLLPEPGRGYPHGAIRVVPGPQDDYFSEAGWATFLNEAYTVTAHRDRMGMTLDGPAIEHARGFNIISDGILCGSIQVPGSGVPIILLADRQTTGGYPKIATVATADLPRLAQTASGATVRFRRIDVAAAEEAALAARRAYEQAVRSFIPAGQSALSSGRLLAANLISGVTAGAWDE